METTFFTYNTFILSSILGAHAFGMQSGVENKDVDPVCVPIDWHLTGKVVENNSHPSD